MRGKSFLDIRHWLLAGALCAGLLASHGCIDEDLSGCDSACDITYYIDLVAATDLHANIQAALSLTQEEQELAAAILQDLQDVVTDKARTIDMSFYNPADSIRIRHDNLQTNASEVSTRLYISPGAYEHIAVANTNLNTPFSYNNADRWTQYEIRDNAIDTAASHTSAVYTGLMHMDIELVTAHTFRLPLNMQNAIAILAIDPDNSTATVQSVHTHQVARGVNCYDQQLIFDNNYVVQNSRTTAAGLIAYYAVCFPSREGGLSTRAGNENEEEEDPAAGSLWYMEIIAQTTAGKYVQNILYVKEPLKAGHAKVIKVKLDELGGLESETPSVGISINFEWQPGNDYDIDM